MKIAYTNFYQNMALLSSRKEKICACLMLAILVNIPALSAKHVSNVSTARPVGQTAPCGSLSFSDFGETAANCSDIHDVDDLITRVNMTQPIFIFREYITEELVMSGRRDAKSMSEGEITENEFIQNNENFLTRAMNHLGNLLLNNKYDRNELP